MPKSPLISNRGEIQGHPTTKKPDFFIVGAPKCGTTSLVTSLNNHPQIWSPTREMNPFDFDWLYRRPDWTTESTRESLRLKWYSKLFTQVPQSMAAGDYSSGRYFYSTRAADSIAQTFPDAKILIMLRDPVDRVFSAYWQGVRSGQINAKLPLSEQVLGEAGILEQSIYSERVARYMDALGAGQVKVILFEDFITHQPNTLQAVWDFLGVNTPYQHQHLRPVWQNKGRYPNSFIFQSLFYRIARAARPLRYTSLVGEPVTTKFYVNFMITCYKSVRKLHTNLNMWRKTKPQVDSQIRLELSALLRDKNSDLQTLLDRNLENVWPTFRLAHEMTDRPEQKTLTNSSKYKF